MEAALTDAAIVAWGPAATMKKSGRREVLLYVVVGAREVVVV
jgi:hypothetical protein